MNPRHVPALLGTLVALLSVPELAAQPAVGSLAPPIEFKKTFLGCPPTLEEMRGSVVLLDYFATW